MTSVTNFHNSQRANGVNAAHAALRALIEHWDSVEINCYATDEAGNISRYELESESDDGEDDDDDGEKVK